MKVEQDVSSLMRQLEWWELPVCTFYSGFSDELKEKTRSPPISSRYDVVESVSELLESYGYILMASKMKDEFSEVTWKDGNDTMRC